VERDRAGIALEHERHSATIPQPIAVKTPLARAQDNSLLAVRPQVGAVKAFG
jgi:hypothetical protein